MVIDESSGKTELMSKSKALAVAAEQELDLVLVSPKARPPVAKILDYGKYKYEQSRKDKQQKKQSKAGETKEIRLSVRMGEHDREQRIKKASKFLKQGYGISLSLRFQGRENIFREKGLEVLEDFAKRLNMNFTARPRFAGNIVNVQLKKNESENTQEQS